MKKLTALLLSVVLVLSLAACGSANKHASSTTQPETSAPTEQPATEPSESSSTAPAESEPETQPETGKTLVVYYSASGNTERVAKDIAEAAGADLFEIVPTEVYTSEDLNWTNSDSRVSREHDDESLRDVPLTTTEVPDWDSYDIVFIGYPIWWGIAAWPVDTFVKTMILPARPSSPLPLLPPPAWVRAAVCWPTWPVPASGRKASGSPPAFPVMMCSPGSMDWVCNA